MLSRARAQMRRPLRRVQTARSKGRATVNRAAALPRVKHRLAKADRPPLVSMGWRAPTAVGVAVMAEPIARTIASPYRTAAAMVPAANRIASTDHALLELSEGRDGTRPPTSRPNQPRREPPTASRPN